MATIADVPPDADLVEHRDEVDAGDVEGQLDDQDDAHRHQLAVERRRWMNSVVLNDAAA